MFICNKCNSEYSGYPKLCPSCRAAFGILPRRESSSPECYPLSSALSLYDSILLFDTETTGLSFSGDRIIELACVRLDRSGSITDKCDIFIKLPSGQKIPEEIVSLTGITDEMLSEEGVSEQLACRHLKDMLRGERNLMIAHNAQFDMNFLYYMLARNGCADLLKSCDMLDTLTVYKDRHEYPHKLANAIEQYGLEDKVQNSHRAIDDVLALYEVLLAMDAECADVCAYINLFGFNPKYGVSGAKISSVHYIPQPYRSALKLYFKAQSR